MHASVGMVSTAAKPHCGQVRTDSRAGSDSMARGLTSGGPTAPCGCGWPRSYPPGQRSSGIIGSPMIGVGVRVPRAPRVRSGMKLGKAFTGQPVESNPLAFAGHLAGQKRYHAVSQGRDLHERGEDSEPRSRHERHLRSCESLEQSGAVSHACQSQRRPAVRGLRVCGQARRRNLTTGRARKHSLRIRADLR